MLNRLFEERIEKEVRKRINTWIKSQKVDLPVNNDHQRLYEVSFGGDAAISAGIHLIGSPVYVVASNAELASKRVEDAIRLYDRHDTIKKVREIAAQFPPSRRGPVDTSRLYYAERKD